MKKILLISLVIMLLIFPVAQAFEIPSFDFDFIPSNIDNCPTKFNPTQRDSDSDGVGDACDDKQNDVDWDGVQNNNDNCKFRFNPNQRDTDNDGKGDQCDKNINDSDWDGVLNNKDNCKFNYNPSQNDYDDDSWGDSCDCYNTKLKRGIYHFWGARFGVTHC